MKVDTSKIPGFSDSMTADEKLAAILGHDFVGEPEKQVANPDIESLSAEVERLKAAKDKAMGEAAEYRKQLRSRLTDEEAKAAKDAEEREKAAEERDLLVKELEALKKHNAISELKASYLSLGYEEEKAVENAKALFAGDYKTVFANQKEFVESQKKAAVAGALDNQPGLSAGSPIGKENVVDSFSASLRKYAGLPPEQKQL